MTKKAADPSYYYTNLLQSNKQNKLQIVSNSKKGDSGLGIMYTCIALITIRTIVCSKE